MWIGGSWVLRETLQGPSAAYSIYGPLAAPIAVLLWLYVLSIAVLIGAALNASFDRVFPEKSRPAPGSSWYAGCGTRRWRRGCGRPGSTTGGSRSCPAPRGRPSRRPTPS